MYEYTNWPETNNNHYTTLFTLPFPKLIFFKKKDYKSTNSSNSSRKNHESLPIYFLLFVFNPFSVHFVHTTTTVKVTLHTIISFLQSLCHIVVPLRIT